MGATAHDLNEWLAVGYAPAYRTACLILRDPRDAEEAVQEAFLRAWRFRDRVRNTDDIRPWLYRVLVNTCRSQQRRDIRHRDRRDDIDRLDHIAEPDDARSPEGSAAAADVVRAVRVALHALPERLRVVAVLRYYAGLSEAEISAAVHCPLGTVKSRLHAARERLGSDPRLAALVLDTPEVNR